MVSQHINSCLLSQSPLKYVRIIIIEDNVNYYLLQAHFLVEIHSKHPIVAAQAGCIYVGDHHQSVHHSITVIYALGSIVKPL